MYADRVSSSHRRDFLKQTVSNAVFFAGPRKELGDASREWRHYGGDAGASRYSPCDRIRPSNVKNLKVAWVHRTQDASERPATAIECTPIVVDGVMYLTTARVRVQALDAATGRLLWTFDPAAGGGGARRSPGVNRGVCYWEDNGDKRIFATYRDQLWSLDAKTGKPVESFGQRGMVDLKKDFDHDMTNLTFKHTSPVVVYRDLVITGGGGGEGPYPEAPGHIRGYDARTGKRRWIFHTVPRPGEFGHDTWSGDSWSYTGGTNCWAGMSVDQQRGLVFAGIGSPSFDFWGGNRVGDNLFGNCVLALDALTGQRKWHFQIVHHDIWDYDLPAQPALISIRKGGRVVDAVVQVTKQGFVFFFDRDTGNPLFPVEERPIAPSPMEGEVLSKTQPFPVKPPPLCRQGFRSEWITDLSPEAHAFVKAQVDGLAKGPLYTAPPYSGGLIHPGFRGGALWGGCCFDPKRNLVFVSSDETTNIIAFDEPKPGMNVRFGLKTREQLLDAEGYPGIKPPWGYLTAIDADKGDFRWRIVNGEFPELTRRGIKKTGSNSHGGSICTAGGLVFMAGTFDKKIRAFESDTGRVLWEYELPAGGFATPCTYEAAGKQFLVIAAGGGKNGSKANDEFIAFSL
ncbi:MAG: pyrroloquinoline quinone-dependent dehydrogenase [Bryobacteraceae bacterium]|nr:pyrroloquinoline quinone-dependent dehydrogenase [Bryobacteraceae bacterium]MDW8377772.1 pyrroloquinoline quinone-dependent dehydrogenase [Bryobacterales bacterium]